MKLFGKIRRLWRRVRQGSGYERALGAEMESWVSLLTEEKLAAGMSGAEARRSALLESGGIEQLKEEIRGARAGAMVEVWLRDVRYALRSLRRSPSFTLVAVLALGLGMGATAAIVSVVDAVLLRPLPYAQPDQLVVMLHDNENPVSPANYLDWSRESGDFAELSAAEYWIPTLSGVTESEKVYALHVTPNLLPLLGVSPIHGRFFLPSTAEPGRDREVIIGYGLWQRRLGGDAGVVGRTLQLNGGEYTIVGVMPEGFRFAPFWATESELWAPLALSDRSASREASSLRVFARLKPGVTLERARSRVATITARLEAEYPGTNRGVTVTSLQEKVVAGVRPALLILLGAVALLLLIACANVAHMLLARASGRQREVAVRAAVGAGRGRLLSQFLAESLVLAGLGGVTGLILAWGGVGALSRLAGQSVPRIEEVGIDLRVVLFAFGLALMTGIAFGLAPALQSARRDAGSVLRDGDRGSTHGLQKTRLRSFLIVSEFALALMLLAGAGLMVRSFMAVQALDPGFKARNVLSAQVTLTGTAHAEPGRRALFFQGVLQRLRSIRGVESAGGINHLPLVGDEWGTPYLVEGKPIPAPGEMPRATYRVVLPGYFETMRIEILRGRAIRENDDLGAPAVVVVNQTMAARYWPSEDPLGKRIALSASDGTPDWLTVVGVVKNAVRSHWTEPPEAEIYLPYLQDRAYLESPGAHRTFFTFVMRTSGNAYDYVPQLRNEVQALDRSVPVSEIITMDEAVAQATTSWRFPLLLLVSFAAVALVLAAIGVYGLMSYTVARRTHEIGIRVALGAARRTVLGMIVGQTMLLVLIGTAAGLCGAFALTRLMASMLYGVGASDPATFVLVWLLLSVTALCATMVPALRAVRADPLRALNNG